MWSEAPCILNLVTDGGEWSTSRFGGSTVSQRAHNTRWIGDCGPDSRSARGSKKTNPTFDENRTPVVRTMASHFTNWTYSSLRRLRLLDALAC
jgi:hypothetical protein